RTLERTRPSFRASPCCEPGRLAVRWCYQDAPQQPVKVVALVGESPTRRIGRFTTERPGACPPARRGGEAAVLRLNPPRKPVRPARRRAAAPQSESCIEAWKLL